MHDQDNDGAVFGLDGWAEPQEAPPTAGGPIRWRIAAACAGVVIVLAGGIGAAVAVTGSQDNAAVVSVTTTSSASAPTTPTTPTPTTSAPTTTFVPKMAEPTATVPPAELASERAELQQTAAQLTALRLSSPASWDRWVPQGKPYPGTSTAEEMSTCPAISSRLTAALGMKFSYWIGTLPNGPNGCDYATVPLSYDGPYTYPYTAEVGYLTGTSAVTSRHQNYEHQGAICPDTDVPAVAPGAVLVRCVNEDITGYTLILPDTRRPDGVWFLEADTRPTARHPASYALNALLSALKPVYG